MHSDQIEKFKEDYKEEVMILAGKIKWNIDNLIKEEMLEKAEREDI